MLKVKGVHSGAFGGRGAGVHRRECRRLAAETPVPHWQGRKDRDTNGFLSLLTPQTFLCADTSEMCSKRG